MSQVITKEQAASIIAKIRDKYFSDDAQKNSLLDNIAKTVNSCCYAWPENGINLRVHGFSEFNIKPSKGFVTFEIYDLSNDDKNLFVRSIVLSKLDLRHLIDLLTGCEEYLDNQDS